MISLWLRLVQAPWDGNEALTAGLLTASCCVASSLLAVHSKNKDVGGWRQFDPVPPGPPIPTVLPESAGVSIFQLCKYTGTLKYTSAPRNRDVLWIWSHGTNIILCVCAPCVHTHTHLHVHKATLTQLPCWFQAQGAGEKRLPNFPSWSTRLHMQMLITTGACMGQSAGCWNSLCISLSLPTGRRFHGYSPGW